MRVSAETAMNVSVKIEVTITAESINGRDNT